MKFLLVETSTPQGGVCISQTIGDDIKILFKKEWSRKKVKKADRGKSPSHSELVGPAIEEGLKELDLTFNDFDFFSTTIGPGSFTGIRVGINVIKSYCYATNKPFFTFNSLLAVALNAREQSQPVLVMQNAFKNQVYLATYKFAGAEIEEVTSPCAVKIEDLERIITTPHLCLGDGFDTYQDSISDSVKEQLMFNHEYSTQPRLKAMSKYVAEQASRLEFNWKLLNPLYIRQSEAEEKLSLGLLKPIPKL